MRNDFMQKFESPIVSLEGKLAEFGSTLKIDREKLFTEPEYFVTVVGEFSAGKSSILNRLFFGENDTIPTALRAETCLINEIRYGDSDKATIVSNGRERDIEFSEISVESRKESIGHENSMVKMECMDDLLSDKVVFVDTPGVNSINDLHADITFGYLPKSQFVLFVVDVNRGGLMKSEIDFIKNKVFTVTQNNMFILLNKADLITEAVGEKVRNRIISDLANTGIRPEKICLVSGLNGTGIAELKAVLKRELDAKRTEYYKNYTQNLIASFADLATAELKLKLANIGKDAGSFAADKAAMEQEIEAVSAKYGQLYADLNRKIADVFAKYDTKIAKDLTKIAQKICAVVKETPLSNISGDNITEGVQVNLRKYVENDLQPAFYDDMRKMLAEISADAETLTSDFGICTAYDFQAPGKFLTVAVFVLENIIYNMILPGGWFIALLGQEIAGRLFGKLRKLMAKPVKSIICENIMDAFNREMIPEFINQFNEKQDDITHSITKAIENSVNSQIAVIENSYNEKNIEALRARENAKESLEAAIKDAEALKALAAN